MTFDDIHGAHGAPAGTHDVVAVGSRPRDKVPQVGVDDVSEQDAQADELKHGERVSG